MKSKKTTGQKQSEKATKGQRTYREGQRKAGVAGGAAGYTAGKPKAGESDRMKKKRASFKARHSKNIAKGKMSAAYWANKVKW
jgi:hypothetical protein